MIIIIGCIYKIIKIFLSLFKGIIFPTYVVYSKVEIKGHSRLVRLSITIKILNFTHLAWHVIDVEKFTWSDFGGPPGDGGLFGDGGDG